MSRPLVAASVAFAVAIVATALAVVLWAVDVQEPFTPDVWLFPVAYLAFAAVGALISARRPNNVIGRLALSAGVGGALVGVADTYARMRTPLPMQDWAAWLASWGFPATLGPILFLLLLFPTGRPASGRWRVVGWTIAGGMVLLAAGNAFSPVFSDHARHPNPLGIPALAGSPIEQGGVGWFLILFGAVAVSVGLVPRLRGAQGIERAQLKWITFAAAIHGLSWLVVALEPPGDGALWAQYLLFATLTLIPVATGIAILRYRLYDIDVVIRRTLVYGAVLAVLGAVYIALVLLLQAALSGLTGGGTLPVAVSTLAIAALFGPVRTRVREVIDRRFYRSQYDAQQTLAAFANRLRDQIELDEVQGALVDAAARTVQPAAAVVWLRTRRS